MILVVATGWVANGEEAWVERTTVERPTGNLSLKMRWVPRAGIRLSFEQKSTSRKVLLDLGNRRTKLAFVPEAAFPSALADSSQFITAAVPREDAGEIAVLLKFRTDAWSVYANDRLVAVLPAALTAPFTVSHPADASPAADHSQVTFQKTGGFRFEDYFQVAEDEKNKLAAWEIRSGAWTLHSAADTTVEEREAPARNNKQATPERSPNYYSLQCVGTNAAIVSGYDFYDAYSLESAVRIVPGEVGVLFDLTDDGGFGFTVAQQGENSCEARLQLWKAASTNFASRTVLAAARTELTPGQWIKLKVRTYLDRVECWVDHTKIFDLPVDLPPGGSFGLYANSDGRSRFDDVVAKSIQDVEYRTLSDMKRQTAAESGRFFRQGGLSGLFGSAPTEPILAPEKSDAPQYLALGPMNREGHVSSAEFEPQDKNVAFGLIAGFKGSGQPYYRFTRCQSRYDEIFLLERVTTNLATVISELRLPLPFERKKEETVRLMCDAGSGKELRLYRDGQLVLFQPMSDLQGASGVYVGPRAGVKIRNLRQAAERDDLYRNQFEKNRLYVEDPFMRHWSSPEGQWLDTKDGMVWHKGDFFGRFLVRLPVITNSQVHVGVEEGTTNGAIVLRVSSTNLSACAVDALTGEEEWLGSFPVKDLAIVPTNAPEFKTAPQWFDINSEGYWLWITSEGRVHLRCRLDKPLHGRRMRIAGFTTEELKHSYVERFNVKDCLFNESLHEWVINGGRWEVVSRFQCMPAWSHMNGESADGMAALWSKYDLRGDFCAEMFVGLRHGWYNRCGDLNMTVMNHDTTPSQGYTVTCTGWDPDHSQLFTRLYRNGNVIAESDKYLVPRIREGNKRLMTDPLIQAGRDVHGAWYYIKFRRVGKRLEYYFDNELVFTTDDKNPILDGSFGLWTFMNSMMVARVKIAADEIRPRPLAFERLDTKGMAPLTAARPADAGSKAAAGGILADGRPVPCLQAANWETDDPVGHTQIKWHDDADGSPWFATRNVMGSGTFEAKCDLPPVPYRQLAGWQFLLKRTPHAQFNFHYSVGRVDGAGKYTAQQSFFHRISGTAVSLAKSRMSGETTVTPVDSTKPEWSTEGAWTPVTVWANAEELTALARDTNLMIKVEGFGNLQPSYEAEGLTGNGPGEGYAVRDFTEILCAPPALARAATLTNAADRCSFTVVDDAGGTKLSATARIEDVQQCLDRLSATGLVKVSVLAQGSGGRTRASLAWLRPPADPPMSCSTDNKRPGTLVLRCNLPYPDRRFLSADVSVKGVDTSSWFEGFRDRIIALPRSDELLRSAVDQIAVDVRAGGKSYTVKAPWKGRADKEPPVLLRIEGLTPFLANFEQRRLDAPLVPDSDRIRLGYFDALQNTYLRVFNPGTPERLRTVFQVPLNLANYPLLQLRYRGTGMVSVSLALDDTWCARMNEDYDQARPVRLASGLTLDGQWHTWRGVVSDAMSESRYQPSLLNINRLLMGSRHGMDQTGLYSEWQLDDLVAGPAVSRKEQLAFTPHYYDYEGVKDVFHAIHAGPEGYEELSKPERSGLRWVRSDNDQAVTPEMGALPNGIHHLFLKARDTAGDESTPTDVPFLVDTDVPKASFAYEKTTDPAGNGTKLRVAMETGKGAPIDLRGVTFRWETHDVTVPSLGSSFIHTPDRDVLLLNWPLIFRHYVDATSDKQTAHIVIANLRDGAGNAAPDLTVPCTIDYASDTCPPTLLRNRFPSNVLYTTSWELSSEIATEMQAINQTRIRSLREPTGEPFIRLETIAENGEVGHKFDKVEWLVNTHPYVALRMRRPTYQPAEKTRIDLVFEIEGKGAYVLPLTQASDDKKTTLRLPSPITWASNEWTALTLDARTLLAGKLPADALAKSRITQLSVRITGATHDTPLDLQSLFILSDWGQGDTITLNAFDASGIAGLTWGEGQSASALTASPATLSGVDRKSGWLALRVRDRAGNVSIPLRIPLPGAQ